MKEKCVVCGKEFDKRGKKITCSPECMLERKRVMGRKFYHKNKDKYKKVKEAAYATCAFCGKRFQKKMARQLYCKPECYYTAVRAEAVKKRQAKTTRTAKCIVCGKEFDPHGTSATLCSDKCRGERKRQLYKKYRSKNAEKQTRSSLPVMKVRRKHQVCLEETVQKAHDNNISYGTFVAMQQPTKSVLEQDWAQELLAAHQAKERN